MENQTPEWAFDEHDRAMMEAALEAAGRALAAGDVPVGAVVVDANGAMLATAHNRRQVDRDPTAHAELLALRAASQRRGDWRLPGCTLYVTLEPCAMCAAACVQTRLAAVVWGAADSRVGFAGSVGNLLEDPRLDHRVACRSGLMAAECGAILDGFFAKLRGQR